MPAYLDDLQSFSAVGFLTFRRRWKLICACALLSMMAAGAFVAFKGVSYTASTQFLVYVKEVQPGAELVISLGRADLTQVENEIEIIRSRGTLAKVVQALDLAEDPEFVPPATLPRDIAQWFFSVPRTSSDASRDRQEIAGETLAKHIAIKRIGTSHTVLVNVTTSDPEKSALIANSISQAMQQARGSADQDGDRLPLLRERLQGLGPNVYVMTPAIVPDKPNGPRKILVLLAATLAGLLVGSVLALLLDLLDRTIRTSAQVERFGLECIGAIPLLGRGQPVASSRSRTGDGARRQGVFPPAPLLTQTLLRMMVAVEAAKARVVGVVAPIGGEGVTTVARHFAGSAARCRRKVLLVEAGPGLTKPEAVIRRDDEGGPDVLTVATLDGGDGAANWWAHCDQKSLAAYDLVVVGLPPLERGPAFRMAAQHIDGILVVMKWGGASLERIERAFSISGAEPSDFIGAVLNGVDDRMIGRFGDRLWEAEVRVASRRRVFAAAMPIESIARAT